MRYEMCVEHNIYDFENVRSSREEDCINDAEEAFMNGYLAS